MRPSEIDWCMEEALEQAEQGKWNGEVPIGAVLLAPTGEIIAKSFNTKECKHDPTGHAEITLLREAGERLNGWRLSDCSLFVTLEPCPMCLSAMIHARIKNLYFGAYDPKGGALSLGYNFHRDQRLNHTFNVTGGILHFRCSKLLSDFFRERRSTHIIGK